MKYSDYVDYSKLNPFKRLAISLFSETFSHPERLGIKVVKETLGEPAVAFDFIDYDFMLGFNVEGLGTKSLIADEMYAKMAVGEAVNGSRFYKGLGQDNIAMSVNDLIAIGAEPFAYGDILSTGDSGYLDDESRMESLLQGFKKGADLSGTALPLGETPTLKDVIYPEAVDLAGASIGIIRPKSHLVYGRDLEAGDALFCLESSGMHSNGVTLARKIVESSPDRYFTEIEGGRIIGEAILEPTHIYAKPVIEMLRKGVKVKYLAPITGHSMRKIMRPKKEFTYRITSLPDPPVVFKALRKIALDVGTQITDYEAYQTWNMGIGFVVMAPRKDSNDIHSICEAFGIGCQEIGKVEDGPKRVIIEPRDIIYQD